MIDCLEFDRNLRSLDPLEEIAYFSLECERLGAGWIGKRVLEFYLDRTGDHLDPAVYGFYRCRRATHRALTTAWHLRDSRERGRRDWRGLATEYLRAAIAA